MFSRDSSGISEGRDGDDGYGKVYDNDVFRL
jgi:hypothetical protein